MLSKVTLTGFEGKSAEGFVCAPGHEMKEISDLGLRWALERKADVLCHSREKEQPGFPPHCRWKQVR